MSDSTAKRRLPPPSILVCDLACLGFAGWTVLCNALVQLGGTPQHLRIAAGIGVLGLAVIVVYAVRTRRLGAWLRALEDPPDVPPEPAAETPAPPLAIAREPSLRTRALFLALGVAAAVAFGLRRDLNELWFLGLVFFAGSYAAVARSTRASASPEATKPGWLAEAGLWAIGLACAVITLCLHRSNSDDAFYANIAVSVVDFPNAPMFAADTLHGIAGASLKIPAYSVSSVELLTGFVSGLLGTETLIVYHLYTPALVALLTPLALARLFRLLDRERFAWAVLAVVILLALDEGGGNGSFNDFAFQRLFQGKAMFATALVPALLAYGVRFALRPSAGRLAMLAAVQIAALGTTVTAFWAAPMLATTGVLVGLVPGRRALPTLAMGAASSAYLLGFGAYFKLTEAATAASSAAVQPAVAAAAAAVTAEPPARETAARLIKHAYAMVLGGDAHLVASIAAVFVAWPLCRTSLARRFAVTVPLLFFAVAGNPWLTDLLVKATTEAVHWRVLWLLPVPLFAALTASAVMRAGRSLFGVVRLAVFALALTLFLQYASPRSSLARRWEYPPRPKVHGSSLKLARILVANLPPHRQAAAPQNVSRVLPMLNGYSYPLVIKPKYLPTGKADRARRSRVSGLLGKKKLSSQQRRWAIAQLDHYRVEGVVVAAHPDPERGWSGALRRAGFAQVKESRGYAIWTRRLAPAPVRATP